MMKERQEPGLSWNFGGLLGTAAGSSAWFLITPFIIGWSTTGVAVALTCAGFVLALVPVLWRMRAKLSALHGALVLLSAAFLATFAFLSYAHFAGERVVTSWPPIVTADSYSCFWMLSLFPILGTVLWLLNKRTTMELDKIATADN